MAEDAETQGRRRQGDKLRTWKVTRLSGEVRGWRARAPGGPGSGARVCLLGRRCARGASVSHPASLVHVLFACGRVHALLSLGVAAFRELLEAGKGYSILRSSARGGRGELSSSRESSGLSRL